MVKVREDYPQLQNGRVDLPRWIDRLPIDRNIVNSEDLLPAFQLAEHCAELPDAGPSGVVDEDGSSLFPAL